MIALFACSTLTAFVSGLIGALLGTLIFSTLVGILGVSLITSLTVSAVGWVMLGQRNINTQIRRRVHEVDA
jgi:hypothetical protein